ncbi:sugar phosphate isomerase/epimerase family protein [Sphaerisporangium aureirubrum]|uniref:Sugar phosphate isomerase/epimerase family protein n=1 Tax=Sphaerisporangium aureirubrum TaxID=1544736 RepID=A0ABW1NIQ1_9ACTN
MARLLTAGLCSVTYRALPPERVIALAAEAGLDHIEWGQDVHVPFGDESRAHRVGEATRAAGLSVSALGSYYRAGAITDPAEDERVWRRVVAAAHALGAPRVRVWAGTHPSATAPPATRRETLDALRRCTESAPGLTVATEFHDRTLTDTSASTRAMLDEIPTLRTYWQPPNGMPTPEALTGLQAVLDRVDAVHAFSWWPTPLDRHPLDHRESLWKAVADMLAATGRPMSVSLEFVPGDDPAVLTREAAALRRHLERATP